MSNHATPTRPPADPAWPPWSDLFPGFWPDERSGDGLPHGGGAPEDPEDWPEEKPAA